MKAILLSVALGLVVFCHGVTHASDGRARAAVALALYKGNCGCDPFGKGDCTCGKTGCKCGDTCKCGKACPGKPHKKIHRTAAVRRVLHYTAPKAWTCGPNGCYPSGR